MTNKEIIIQKLKSVFSQDKMIIAGYLFGSVAQHQETAQSDLDIAVLLTEVPEDLLDQYTQLAAVAANIVKEREIDLVILNIAPPALRHQVFKHGQLVYCRDERARVAFEVRAEREYLDLVWFWERYDQQLLEELAQRGGDD